MLFWDETIGNRSTSAAALSREAACAVTVAALSAGVLAVRAAHPLAVPPEVAQLVDRTLAAVQESAPTYQLEAEVADVLSAQLNAAWDGPLPGVCGPLLHAVSYLLDGATEGFAANVILDALSAVYEFVFVSTVGGRATEEAERAGAACAGQISLQNRLLDEHCSRRERTP